MKTFRSPGLHLFLFCFFFVLFNWPILSIFEGKQDAVFFYTFLAWGAVVIASVLISLNLKPVPPYKKGNDETGC